MGQQVAAGMLHRPTGRSLGSARRHAVVAVRWQDRPVAVDAARAAALQRVERALAGAEQRAALAAAAGRLGRRRGRYDVRCCCCCWYAPARRARTAMRRRTLEALVRVIVVLVAGGVIVCRRPVARRSAQVQRRRVAKIVADRTFLAREGAAGSVGATARRLLLLRLGASAGTVATR